MKRKKKVCRICHKEKILWSRGRCKTCASKQDRKPISKSKKPINPISDKEKERKRKYMALRKEYLKDHPYCEVEDCLQPATQIHHKAFRDGENLFKHFLGVCSRCHEWIHANPIEARELGYLLSKNHKDEE